jgi:hypothetical protein
MIKKLKFNFIMKNQSRNFLLVILGLTFFLSGCEKELFNGCLKGKGDIETRLVQLDPFYGINLNIDGEIILYTAPDGFEVMIEAESNVIDAIIQDSEVVNETWEIDIQGCSQTDHVVFHVFIPFLITPTAPPIEKYSIHISGEGSAKTAFPISFIESFDLSCSGKASFEISVEDSLKSLNFSSSGDGTLEVAGYTKELNISINGDGKVKAFPMEAETCNIDISGDGDCEVNVLNALDVKFSGSGQVCYRGQPAVTIQVSGDGIVTNCN